MPLKSRLQHAQDDLDFLTASNGFQHLVYAINISARHRYVYFETPKVACSTIKRFLIKNELPGTELFDKGELSYEEFDFLHNREFSPLLNVKQAYPFRRLLQPDSGFFRFCFVRNPYDRLLSAWLDKIVGDRPQALQVKAVLGLSANATREISFAEFVEVVAATPAALMDPHWRPQHLHNCVDVMDYHFIGRMERLEEGMAHVCRETGLDPAHLARFSPHRNDAGDKLAAHYTPALRKRVYKVFEQDFEAFGYPRRG
ncbi:sulfotransferase family protein (plasmid) [Paroceanicella profunda]|uniref:Sulfotransferase family protein n=1 Tax=Paroceanicella profunda TaxID=2579971 RepID=A0A5B8G539_9RHOB|nr:sulfotransferase family protein [Paroceanicella profunda]QDL94412.1 sulfotransferase family protein [Paroceanicella profunda]